MAANEKKKVVCTLTVCETALYGEHPPRTAHVKVEATSVAQALETAKMKAMSQLKGRK